MDQFDIIGAIETYALSQNWKFIYGFNDFYNSAASIQEYQPDEMLLIADSKDLPRIVNGRIVEIEYTCLLMLGRKFDDTGEAASLDETFEQKYDRRLKELKSLLAIAIGQIACDNELEVTAGEIITEINQYASNIDFAVSANTKFVQ